jgi:hypothetical protein
LNLSEIVKYGQGASVFKITDLSGRQWLLDIRNLNLSALLYRPLSFKAKLHFTVLRLLSWFNIVEYLPYVEVERIQIDRELLSFIKSKFALLNPYVSFFSGTPGGSSKILVQVSDDIQVHGYIKMTGSESVLFDFKKEAEVLSYLHELNVPRVMHIEEIRANTFLMVQSSCSGLRKSIRSKWSKYHTGFLHDIYCRFPKKRISVNELYIQSCILDKLYKNLPEGYIFLFNEVSYLLKNRFPSELNIYVRHGDFTPWNIFEIKNNLYVYDWESSDQKSFVYYDYFHFIVQSELIIRKSSPTKILQVIKSNLKLLDLSYFECDWRLYLLAYLMDIMHYNLDLLNKGILSIDTNLNLRMNMLEMTLNEIINDT